MKTVITISQEELKKAVVNYFYKDSDLSIDDIEVHINCNDTSESESEVPETTKIITAIEQNLKNKTYKREVGKIVRVEAVDADINWCVLHGKIFHATRIYAQFHNCPYSKAKEKIQEWVDKSSQIEDTIRVEEQLIVDGLFNNKYVKDKNKTYTDVQSIDSDIDWCVFNKKFDLAECVFKQYHGCTKEYAEWAIKKWVGYISTVNKSNIT